MRLLLILACLFSSAAFAQARDVQRALQQRQQRSDEFALQLRQSQQRLQVMPGDLNQQQSLESQQLGERQRLENFGAQQQLSISQGAGESRLNRDRQVELQRPYELRLPPPQVRAPIAPRPKERDSYFPSFTN